MRLKFAALAAVWVTVIFFSTGVFAQAAQTIALKSGETAEEQSYSEMTLRINYRTKDGQREQSFTFNLAPFP
jgi:hypothetical protein